MAQDSIKDFALTWVLFGLLFISLLTFSINFIYDNTDDFQVMIIIIILILTIVILLANYMS